jgi:hypothetical protein
MFKNKFYRIKLWPVFYQRQKDCTTMTSKHFFQPDNALPNVDQPPPISSQIELQVVDLISLTRVGKPLTGHQGFTPSEKAFYLYADVSNNYVGSGSEDGRGCLWDRHYGTLVRQYQIVTTL